MRFSYVLLLAFLSCSDNAWAGGPSFNCRGASSDDDHEICNSPHLSSLELTNAIAFLMARELDKSGKAGRAAIFELQNRRNCHHDTACIESALQESINMMHGIAENALK